MWFDTHCHLYDVEEPAAALERAHAAFVLNLVVLGVDVAESERALELAENEGVWAGAAFHPTSTKGWRDEWATDISRLLENEKVVAVGETGIDLYWDKTYLDDQSRAFQAHIRLAKEHAKPLVIHTRDSFDEAAEILEEVGPPQKLVFHCWSGDEAQMSRALSMGSMISFAGNVSFKKAENLRSAAAAVPADRLLIETDSPYLAPVPRRGKPNEPAYVVHVGEAVAAARAISPDAVAEMTTANALRFFGLDS